MDVKIAFLNGEVEEKVYIKQLDGFLIQGKESMCASLGKPCMG